MAWAFAVGIAVGRGVGWTLKKMHDEEESSAKQVGLPYTAKDRAEAQRCVRAVQGAGEVLTALCINLLDPIGSSALLASGLAKIVRNTAENPTTRKVAAVAGDAVNLGLVANGATHHHS